MILAMKSFQLPYVSGGGIVGVDWWTNLHNYVECRGAEEEMRDGGGDEQISI